MAVVAGYSNKTEAIRALDAQGLTPFMIAEQIGSTPGSVSERLRQLRKAAAGDVKPKAAKAAKPKAEKVKPVKEATRDTRGIWTPEKLAKAHRLFGKIIIYVAEALEVPADELLKYGVNGVMPPMGEKQRVAQLVNRAATPPAEQPLQLAAPAAASDQAAIDADQEQQEQIELGRAADEAELAALEQQEANDDDDGSGPAPAPAPQAAGEPAGKGSDPVTPPAPRVAPQPGHEYYLTDEAGQWLHESLEALTKNRRYAWKGTTKKIELVLQRMPKWKVLVPERVA